MPKIYVAGKFEEKVRVRQVMARLVAMGYEITHDWTEEDATGLSGDELAKYLESCALADFEGVLDADCVLVLNHQAAFGAMVEMGLALGWGKVVYVVEPQIRDNIFYHLPATSGMRTFETLEKALDALQEDLDVDTDW